MMVKSIAATLALATLAACASTPPPVDHREALLRPCPNASDWAPWLLVDKWSDGEVYKPETQFRDDGVMVYAYNGMTYDNGRWTLDGDKLHFDTNNHFADYDGTFDGDRASGSMKNTDGNGGMWTLERDCTR